MRGHFDFDRRAAAVIWCWAICILILAVIHEGAALVPVLAGAAVIVCRKSDPVGALLFLILLSLQAAVIYALARVLSLAWASLGGKIPFLLASLFIIKEFNRFLDDEYGQGRPGRRAILAFSALTLAAVQIALVYQG